LAIQGFLMTGYSFGTGAPPVRLRSNWREFLAIGASNGRRRFANTEVIETFSPDTTRPRP
jgi:hypothetical protein